MSRLGQAGSGGEVGTPALMRPDRKSPLRGPVRVRLSKQLVDEMRADLSRPHRFAAERVGFVSVATGAIEDGELLVIGVAYHAVPDEQYVPDETVGARIGPDAIREAIQRVMDTRRGCFHVHLHPGRGLPNFSWTDAEEQPRLVESLRRPAPLAPHGMIVLSDDLANAWVWLPRSTAPVAPMQISIVGDPMTLIGVDHAAGGLADGAEHDSANLGDNDSRFARQSFLGRDAQAVISQARIGVIGLGGGGSHIVQQLVHLGVRSFRLFDGDRVSTSNLNRLVGAGFADAETGSLKADVAKRVISAVERHPDIIAYPGRWQDRPDLLRGCDVVVGAVDTFAARREIEVACRRHCIPYIDIGMDVNQVGGDPPRMAGQVICSMPDGPCMFCLGFLTEERLAEEAAQYGAAGERPQVVWPNGVLASTAVGIGIDLLTGWTRQIERAVYLSYDGNSGAVRPHVRLRYMTFVGCTHYPAGERGDPVFEPI